MIGVSTTPYHLVVNRKFNTWYSIKDGNWDDPSIWMSNGGRKRGIPRAGDDVWVGHAVSWNYSSPNNMYNNVIRDLHITGTFLCNSNLNQTRLTVTGNIFCSGTLDLSGSAGGGGFGLNIGGDKSYFNNFVQGDSKSNININYYSPNSFMIPNIPYYSLTFGSTPTKSFKWINSNLTIPGSLSVGNNVVLELGDFDLSVYYYQGDGIQSSTLSKTGPGTVSFTGPNHTMSGNVSFSGNPTVNLSGSFNGNSRATAIFNFGIGVFNILQNSTWAFSSPGNAPFSLGSSQFLISSGKTLTIAGLAPWQNDGTINGLDSTSALNIVTSYCYANNNTIMSTGAFNHNYSGTSSIWSRVPNFTLPDSSYYKLIVDGGTTTLSSNTTIANSLSITNGASLQLSSYNFTVNGETINNGVILKSGSGIVNFSSLTVSTFGTSKLDFSSGNPTVNLFGNLTGDVRGGYDFGTSPVNIKQSINIAVWTSANYAWITSNSFLISSGKTLTNTGLSSSTGGIDILGKIDGEDNTSIFDNRSLLVYRNPIPPMILGKMLCNQSANTVSFSLMGNQDIAVPKDTTNPGYVNLHLAGSGVKTLLGDISVKNNYTLVSPATLNLNGFILSNP